MADVPADPSVALTHARLAIERGNYSRAVELLQPLCDVYPPLRAPGDTIRLLLATALMGQGKGQQAADCCRSLLDCADGQRRAQARDLLQVLEAPALRRPREWSLTLPRLDQAPPLEGFTPARRAAPRLQAEGPPPPPVGPTRGPLGFAAVVLLLLVALLLSGLLSGCMRVETRLDFEGPGRVRVQHRLTPVAATPLPFQKRWAAALTAADPPYRSVQNGATSLLMSPLLNPRDALASLQHSIAEASRLAGLSLPPPALEWRETNWLLGVHQEIRFALDLQDLPSLPGLDLRLRLSPLSRGAIRQASPSGVQVTASPRAWIWQLQPGEVNSLVIRCWRWNPLGLGGLGIVALLLLVVQLQRIRVRLGMGLPELPA